MGVFHPNFSRTSCTRALDGGNRLTGHDFAEFLPIGVTLLGLVPMGYACHTFNINAYVDFHLKQIRAHED